MADNDWVEIVNRNGVIACRAVVSHRIPAGSAFMYHSQDRHVNVPISETSGHRGGTDNSVTRIMIKPTHLIGGYGQLSPGFNYYGAIGTQRDELTIVRLRPTEVLYVGDVAGLAFLVLRRVGRPAHDAVAAADAPRRLVPS